ncbi:hypothetical protein SAMN05216317_11179 [Nitrosomonas eutropha]|uniref:Uncharacterized protein n=1 Tax=Nitrosomonas eutropha TaxID=916 RepID=A0ABX5M8U7_9PROT|nr:hypothetical protein C8R14_1102 [Nitrosomonas eutropha]SCX12186.1 hypothetical protein SAMN05216379_10789 [Nitrosomonas eutropha]SDW74690.1 hypothetical protein SAMN05216317_11179 [Nitrosomonas eutropha]SEI73287.1 hypothetical protein SAMN05216318_10977 [Nitrosomonas eutropha]
MGLFERRSDECQRLEVSVGASVRLALSASNIDTLHLQAMGEVKLW